MFRHQFREYEIHKSARLWFVGLGKVEHLLSEGCHAVLGSVGCLEGNVSIKQKLDAFHWQP